MPGGICHDRGADHTPILTARTVGRALPWVVVLLWDDGAVYHGAGPYETARHDDLPKGVAENAC